MALFLCRIIQSTPEEKPSVRMTAAHDGLGLVFPDTGRLLAECAVWSCRSAGKRRDGVTTIRVIPLQLLASWWNMISCFPTGSGQQVLNDLAKSDPRTTASDSWRGKNYVYCSIAIAAPLPGPDIRPCSSHGGLESSCWREVGRRLCLGSGPAKPHGPGWGSASAAPWLHAGAAALASCAIAAPSP